MDVVVREATSEDWPAVAALLAELGRPDVRGHGEESHRQAFFAYLQRADAVALVATAGGDVVGFIDMEYRQRLNFDRPQAWIPDLIVAEAARWTGVGTLLLRTAERLARDAGCWGMGLESATWRTDTHRFYEARGWTHGGKAFSKTLTGQSLQRPPA